ncbi:MULTISPECIES: DUF4169 family protein [unclassified Caulobacter]|uniref:DUF4169 family protein n=1 Tax=unclassified Caulobacter TaxID=2648921 RepID=UPI0013C59D1F|nr:DUF4169 family protein [Caulobacter sp. 17J80-11]NEX92853.1 DUF4169 family protein [Caulobacter sp. 17J65-9]
MGEIVNLNKARKAKARDADKARAVENRAKHGRTKADRAVDEAERQRARKALDAHEREDQD